MLRPLWIDGLPLFLALLAFLPGCEKSGQRGSGLEERAPRPLPQPIQEKRLANPFQLTKQVYSGGQPEGEQAFRALKELGIKTILSVDGARPDAELAKRFGMRYVHLPIGYEGVAPERALELAKATRDLPGPLFVHCHYGKHRAPAAAALACVMLGKLEPEAATAALKAAGTDPHYQGLYAAVAAAKTVAPKALDRLRADFPSAAQVPPLAEMMLDLDASYDRLRGASKNGWKAPADHPDVDPAHEVMQLR